MNLGNHVESFDKLATEKIDDALWKRLYDSVVIKLMSPVLLVRTVFHLHARIAELEQRVATMEKYLSGEHADGETTYAPTFRELVSR